MSGEVALATPDRRLRRIVIFTDSNGFKALQSLDPVEYKSLDIYGKAFNDRVVITRKETAV